MKLIIYIKTLQKKDCWSHLRKAITDAQMCDEMANGHTKKIDNKIFICCIICCLSDNYGTPPKIDCLLDRCPTHY